MATALGQWQKQKGGGDLNALSEVERENLF
jgi:hypothetical protein